MTESPELQDWLTGENRSVWLYGIPGAGKTVLASLVIDEALRESSDNTAVAYFYCDDEDRATQQVSRILTSLVEQIAKQDEQSFEKVQEFYKIHNPEQRDDTKYGPEELRDLILDMTSMFDCVMIDVDALDECGVDADQTFEMLVSLNDCDFMNIKTLFLSLDEPNIRQLLNTYTQLPIAARSSDLRLYVAAEIESRTRKGRLRVRDKSLVDYINVQ